MRRALSTLLLLSLTVLPACGDGGTGASKPADLVGTWTATAIIAAPVSNPSNTQNLYAEGFRLTFTFQSNGSYSILSSFPGEAPETTTGTYTQSGSNLTLTESGVGGEVVELTVTVSGSNGTFIVKNVDIDDELANLTVTVRKS